MVGPVYVGDAATAVGLIMVDQVQLLLPVATFQISHRLSVTNESSKRAPTHPQAWHK